jgi:hypothetical protein
VGATPIADSLDTRYEAVSRNDLESYRNRGGTYLGSIDAFIGAQVRTRADGFFLFSVSTGPTFPKRDLDELALAVSMAAKAKLGHIHDVHRPDAQPKRRSQRNLVDAIGDVLVCEPIEVETDAAHALFEKDVLGDTELCALRARIPPSANRSAPGESGRLALLCIRRRYLRVFETLQEILKDERDRQLRAERAPQRLAVLLLATATVLGLLFVAFLGWPPRWGEFSWQEIAAALIVLVSATLYMLHNAEQLVRWDHPRIRFLRSSQTFYHYANPLNSVIGRLLKPRAQVPDFAALQGILETKAAGETHRTSMRQFWMTVTVAVVAIYFAALSIRDSTERAIAKPEHASAHLTLDCGTPLARRAVGPFAPGEWSGVEPGGLTPEEVISHIEEEQAGQFDTIVLIGSSDEMGMRRLSPVESNSQLARLRANWVASELMRRANVQVVTFDETMPVERVVLNAGTSGREVIVCVRSMAAL